MCKAYKAAGHDVTGLAHSRTTDYLRKLDLTNFSEADAFFEIARPDCELCYLRVRGPAPSNKRPEGVIHCAAERRPGTHSFSWSPFLRPGFLSILSLTSVSYRYRREGTSNRPPSRISLTYLNPQDPAGTRRVRVSIQASLNQHPQAYQVPPQLNVDACQHLAELAAKLKFTLIYISTGKRFPDRTFCCH